MFCGDFGFDEFDIGYYMVYNNIRMKIHLLLVSLIVSIFTSSCIPVVVDGPPPPGYNTPMMPYQQMMAPPMQYGGYNGGGIYYENNDPQRGRTHYGGPDMPQSRIGGFMPASWAEAKARGW